MKKQRPVKLWFLSDPIRYNHKFVLFSQKSFFKAPDDLDYSE